MQMNTIKEVDNESGKHGFPKKEDGANDPAAQNLENPIDERNIDYENLDLKLDREEEYEQIKSGIENTIERLENLLDRPETLMDELIIDPLQFDLHLDSISQLYGLNIIERKKELPKLIRRPARKPYHQIN